MTNGPFGAAERAASAVPIRPGVPRVAPFWNGYATRFIYAPAFDFPAVPGARRYRFEVTSQADSNTRFFESDVAHAPLSPVWEALPVGRFHLRVTGVSEHGELLGVAGEGDYGRAAPFDGPYHQPVLPYDESGELALERVLHKDYVQHWLSHGEPHPTYVYYRHPAKVIGALVSGAVTYARRTSDPGEAERAKALAVVAADYLIGTSFPPGSYLEHFPPAYQGDFAGKDLPSHMQLTNYLIIAAAETGHAYLDLYDLTGDSKYFDAAHRIAQTYLKTQLPGGTWQLYVNHQTGELTAPQLAIPTSTVVYFNRLARQYGVAGLEDATARALAWVMEHPARTFYWLAQFEDINITQAAPYQKMSREQACDLAMYLFKDSARRAEDLALAEDLVRFSEDQFVTWEQPEEFAIGRGATLRPPDDMLARGPQWYSLNWITPTVHEQYGFWMPVARSAGIMLETYWHAYSATKRPVYLAKAVSIANTFTVVQREHDGDYPTMFTKYPANFWINNAIHPARVMIAFADKLRTVAAPDAHFAP